MSYDDHRYSEADRAAVYRAIAERRDMRHFLPDPEALANLLAMPPGSKPVAILCLGHVEAFYPAPMLELEGWTQGHRLEDMVFSDGWGNSA